MIDIDGSFGEGGGQIIRTALALSALTGNDCVIRNIRQRRPNPGIQAQHLAAIEAMGEMCGAEISGNRIGSAEVVFKPGKIKFGSVDVHIPTAGSIGLVLQPIIIASCRASENLYAKIDGGATHGKWAPPIGYVKEVLLNHISRFGCRVSVEVERYGYYPKGGARVLADIKAPSIRHADFINRGAVKNIFGVSHASSSLRDKNVAERQAEAASSLIEKRTGVKPEIEVCYFDTHNPGSGVEMFALTDDSILGADSIGEMRKPAEEVGTEAASRLLEEISHGCPLDQYAEDQLLPYMALSEKESRMRFSRLTDHARTNMWVIEKFLPVKFVVDEKNKIVRCVPMDCQKGS